MYASIVRWTYVWTFSCADGSCSRMPRKRTNWSTSPPRMTRMPSATAPTMPMDASARRRVSRRRYAPASSTAAAAAARPSPAAAEPDTVTPTAPATPAATSSHRGSAIAGRSARTARASSSDAPAERREVVVAEEGRLPPPRRPRVEDVDAEDLEHADERRRARPDDERPEHELEVARLRSSSGTAGASSAYSPNFAAVTACVDTSYASSQSRG